MFTTVYLVLSRTSLRVVNSIRTQVMALDGLAIEIRYEDARVHDLLVFLLADLVPVQLGGLKTIARYQILQTPVGWALTLQGKGKMAGDEVEFANLYDLIIPFFDRAMIKFAQENKNSICLHAALVSDTAGSILLPGVSGSGKSSASLWLSHLGMHYHSDEMITINRETLNLCALTRPYILKKPVMKALKKALNLSFDTCREQGQILESRLNTWIDHRLINPDFQLQIPALKAIVFPVHTTGNQTGLTALSKAHAGMELMRSHFQSQRIADHGFSIISGLARKLPAYLMVYDAFHQMSNLTDCLRSRL